MNSSKEWGRRGAGISRESQGVGVTPNCSRYNSVSSRTGMAASPSTCATGKHRPGRHQSLSIIQAKVKQKMEMDRKSMYHLDADTLDCPICTEPLSPPVYQCENGHTACAACCEKITKGCPSCSQPTGRIRCLAVEKILESLQVACKHANHGCKEMLRYNKRAEREEHEKETCKYKPFPCYLPYCMHEGPSFTLPAHLAKDHKVGRMQLNPLTGSVEFLMSTSDYYMLVELEDGGLLLVHREDKNFLGDSFFCTTISGASEVYNLKIKRRAGSSFYVLETSAPDIQKNVPKFCVSKEYLLVPIPPGDHCHPREFDVQVSLPNVGNF